LARIASLNFLRLFTRGRFWLWAKWYPKKSKPPGWVASTIRVLTGCQIRPACWAHSFTRSSASLASPSVVRYKVCKG